MLQGLIDIFFIGNTKKLVVNPDSYFFEINNWELSRFILKKIIPTVGVVPYPLSELLMMAGAIVWSNPDLVIEWGTHHGKSARIFYETCKYYNLKASIHSVDLPPNIEHIEQPGSSRGKLLRGISAVSLHLGDGLDVATKLIMKNRNRVKKVLFFCDGDHEYSSVLRELTGIDKLPVEAHILIHDTFYQVKNKKYNIGPYRAVQEFNKKHEYIEVTQNIGLPGMTYLYRKSK